MAIVALAQEHVADTTKVAPQITYQLTGVTFQGVRYVMATGLPLGMAESMRRFIIDTKLEMTASVEMENSDKIF